MLFTIIHTESAVGWGGQEIRVFRETQKLAERGHKVIVLCQPGSELANKCGEVKDLNFSFYTIPMRRTLDFNAVFHIVKIIKKEKVSLVHTHSSIDSWVGSFAAKLAGVKIVRTRHVSIPVKNFFPKNLVYRFPDKIVTTGDTISEILKKISTVKPDSLTSIPTGVDFKRFSTERTGEKIKKEFNIQKNQFVIGKIAVIRSWKGHKYFIEAAEKVLKEFPDALFLIVGPGVGYEETKKTVRLKGLEDNIVMTGYRQDIPDIMAALDLVVLASFGGEGIPQVVPQAYAMKRCVLATSAGGIPDIVKDGINGVLVPPRESDVMARAMISLLNDPEKRQRLAENGYTYAVKHLSEDQMISKTVELYKELITAI